MYTMHRGIKLNLVVYFVELINLVKWAPQNNT